MNKIKIELMLYKEKKADLTNINLLIEELREDGDLTRAISYMEKVQTSTVNNFKTTDEIIESLEKMKKKLLRDILRVDNALTILDEKERQAIIIKYINKLPQANVEITIDRCGKQTKRILDLALEKMIRFF